MSDPGYSRSYYHHATQGAPGTHPTTYGPRTPPSPWSQPGMPPGYDPSQAVQQSPVGQSPRVPPYSPRLANEADLPYTIGFVRQPSLGPMTPPSWSPSQRPALHPHQAVNDPYTIGFIRPTQQNSRPNTAAWPPPPPPPPPPPYMRPPPPRLPPPSTRPPPPPPSPPRPPQGHGHASASRPHP